VDGRYRGRRPERFEGGDVTLDFLKQFNQEISVLPGNTRKRLPAHQIGQAPYVIHQRLALSIEIKTAGPAISRIVTSRQPSLRLHAIKGSHESHRIKIRLLRELHLVDSFVIGQIYKHFALRQRQVECACSLVEALYVSAADVPQEKTESAQLLQLKSRRCLVTIIWDSLRRDYINCYQ
jgi:hypothetical protein